MTLAGGDLRARIEAIYRDESRRVLATLIRLVGDFDLAEEALHDAKMAALEQWPVQGMPDRPRAWLISAGRFKAIDRIRRRARLDATIGWPLTDAGRLPLNYAGTSRPACTVTIVPGEGRSRTAPAAISSERCSAVGGQRVVPRADALNSPGGWHDPTMAAHGRAH